MPGWPGEDDRKFIDRLQAMFPEGFNLDYVNGRGWWMETPDDEFHGSTMADAIAEAVKHHAKAPVG